MASLAEAAVYSRFNRAMKAAGIAAGRTAWPAEQFEQLPKPSLSIVRTILRMRLFFSALPWGSRPRWPVFALTMSMAELFGHAAAHAPQPMQAAGHRQVGNGLRNGRMLASGAEPQRSEIKPPA